jgi:molybdopterin-guanine dinucleotide biosynthesis protein B
VKVFGLVGWSGSGKTTLLVSLLPLLIGRGLSVSTMKHTHETVDLDQPGKDSFRHRTAGASEVMLLSSARWTLLHELRGEPEPSLEVLLAHMTPVDLVLVEGFKRMTHDKMEVCRAELGRPLLCRDDPRIVAVVSDRPISDLSVPVFDPADGSAIADFIVDHCRLRQV